MTSSCRDILTDAFAALGVVPFGTAATADEIDGGVAAISAIVLGLHASRGPLLTVDVGSDYVASENERVRVEAGAIVSITLPNSITYMDNFGSDDYGHVEIGRSCTTWGSTTAADGRLSFPPRDGSRIEIVGVTQALYFYRSDINSWILAAPLTVDSATPLNGRYDSALAALVAERLCDPMNVSPSTTLARRIARANAALLLQTAASPMHFRPAYL